MSDANTTADASSVKSIKEVAKLLGVSDKSINNWLDRGAPGKTNGRYDVDAIRKWREENLKPPRNVEPQEPGLASAKAREAAARARHWELRVQQAEGILVEAAEVRAAIFEHYSFARALIVDLPSKLLSRIELKSAGDKARASDVLRTVTDDFLSALSDAIRAIDRTAEESAERHASAKAGRKPKTRNQQ